MDSKYLQIRGTSGTGKTTIVKQLMMDSEAQPDFINEGEFDDIKRIPPGKVLAYRGHYAEVPLIFLGSYEAVCGGCDTIPSVHITAKLMSEYLKTEECIVVMEGLMISHMLGTVGAAQAEHGKENGILAFLDTPLDVALVRIQQRRDDRGEKRPFNPDNTIKDFDAVRLSEAKALRDGFRVQTIPYEHPMPAVANMIATLHREIKGIA